MIKKILLILIAIVVLYLLIVLLYATWHDYQPDEKVLVSPDQISTKKIINKDTLNFLIWNIGYGGLGAESDFFYADGRIFLSRGMMIRPPESIVKKNTDGILATIRNQSICLLYTSPSPRDRG